MEIVIAIYMCILFVSAGKEYGQTIWSPHEKSKIKDIENVQRRASKQLPGMKEKEYSTRLTEMDLPCLLSRRIRGDLIEVYKILHGKYDEDISKDLLALNNRANTRGNGMKVEKRNTRLDIRKHFFTIRVTNMWNSLAEDIVKAPSLNSFKNKLDKELKARDLYYNFEHCLGVYTA